MYNFRVTNFDNWRELARKCIKKHISPQDINWQENVDLQNSLFDSNMLALDNIYVDNYQSFNVPKKFIQLAKKISCHRNIEKWHLLYEALWRIAHGEKYLLDLKTDPTVHALYAMNKMVSRDAHKMKAFVRFKSYKIDEEEFYIAYHQPLHKIIELVAPFFQERFAIMKWQIHTPDGSAIWDGKNLFYANPVAELPEIKDDIETLWLTYYRSIFNHARIKIKAMCKEMPKCYWRTLPETKLIPIMLQEVPQKINKMLDAIES